MSVTDWPSARASISSECLSTTISSQPECDPDKLWWRGWIIGPQKATSLIRRGRNAVWLLLFSALSASCCDAAEICRFVGTTNYDGHVAVTASVDSSEGVTRIDVALTLDATTFWTRLRYLVEEISTWRGREMESVAVNTRYLVRDHIVRQQWDTFQRSSDGLLARRVQAKTLDDFRQRHPGFVPHWDPSTFGSPWLRDYPSAAPERRADLDLKGPPLPEGLGSPLAMAFYWSRWLPDAGENAAIFLPGFKANKVADVRVTAADGGARHASLQYPALDKTPASTATIVTSPDHHLLALTFDVHGPAGSAVGQLHQAGCSGSPEGLTLGISAAHSLSGSKK